MKTVLIVSLSLLVIVAAAVALGVFRTQTIVNELTSELKSEPQPPGRKVRFSEFSSLPPAVARYFQLVLADGQPFISEGTFEQTGKLRTEPGAKNWMKFSATQRVSPLTPGFVWNAKVGIWGPFHVRVLDSYIRGIGSGLVRVLSAFTAGEDRNTPELNSGALHRYLAEAVWYPTALLPESGVQWTAIDENRATASIRDRDVAVSLEFRFNQNGEVIGIYSPGRWGSFDGGYKQVAWEGHFSDYQTVQGMRVPSKGEVGWYSGGQLSLVWQGEILKAAYVFAE